MRLSTVKKFGAQGITVHPRPDERHIRRQDVFDIRPIITTEFNIEGYPSEDFIQMVIYVKAHQVTLVPDSHDQLTSDHGWDTIKHMDFLKEVIARFKEAGIRTSIFVDPDLSAIEGAKEIGTDRIELYTEPFATMYPVNPISAVAPFKEAANLAHKLGLGINAGHDLSLKNLRFFPRSCSFSRRSVHRSCSHRRCALHGFEKHHSGLPLLLVITTEMNLFFREEGEGFPIVIVHGLYGSSDNWLTVGKKLSTSYKVYMIDQRNHGRSPNSEEHSYEAMKNDLAEFFDQQKIEKAILMGHSMGGKNGDVLCCRLS